MILSAIVVEISAYILIQHMSCFYPIKCLRYNAKIVIKLCIKIYIAHIFPNETLWSIENSRL